MASSKLLDVKCEYPKKSFKIVAGKVWQLFFEQYCNNANIAYWVLEADSATIKLSARNYKICENSPKWVSPISIVVLVDGIIELLNTQNKSACPQIRHDFRDWAKTGIIEAFNSTKVSNKFNACVNQNAEFGILTTNYDEGLNGSDLELIWSNQSYLTLTKIRATQKKAKI
jgi:hypothetical protein